MAYFFGLGKGHLSAEVARVAEEHGAELVNLTEPWGERRHWFECRNLGSPHDQNKATEVFNALEESGVSMLPVEDVEDES